MNGLVEDAHVISENDKKYRQGLENDLFLTFHGLRDQVGIR